jgi:pyridoxal 5'-phosphate synthase pdxS subunit
VLATTHYDDPDAVARASEGLKDAMPGLEISKIPREELMAVRGW